MTERYSDPPASDRRMTTGEFRSAPDVSANTAQFQAFAAQQGERTSQFQAIAAGRRPSRVVLLTGALILVVAVVVILAVTLG
jgi:hypothetical protein